MARSFVPAGVRSATAVAGVSDMRDENIYSSALLQNGGAGPISLFTVPKGQAIPALRGAASAASTNAWQTTHGDHSTSLEKAGELGDGTGDAAFRGIALHLEQARITDAAGGGISAFGATQLEIADLGAKAAFELRVGKKPMFKSPFFALPTVGGAVGSMASTINNAVYDTSTNGRPGSIRRLIRHIMCSRRDTLEGVLTVANSAVLAFRSAAADGVPCLLWCLMPSNVRGDAR